MTSEGNNVNSELRTLVHFFSNVVITCKDSQLSPSRDKMASFCTADLHKMDLHKMASFWTADCTDDYPEPHDPHSQSMQVFVVSAVSENVHWLSRKRPQCFLSVAFAEIRRYNMGYNTHGQEPPACSDSNPENKPFHYDDVFVCTKQVNALQQVLYSVCQPVSPCLFFHIVCIHMHLC